MLERVLNGAAALKEIADAQLQVSKTISEIERLRLLGQQWFPQVERLPVEFQRTS
jgi:hypothetical protein